MVQANPQILQVCAFLLFGLLIYSRIFNLISVAPSFFSPCFKN